MTTFRLLFFLMACFFLGTITACELYKQDDYVEQYVVESYLIAHEELPLLLLSTTSSAHELFDFSQRVVSGGEVLIHRYGTTGVRDTTYRYMEERPGLYLPQGSDTDLVLPRHTYRLEITLPQDDHHKIYAETVVPDTFSIVETVRSRTVYQSENRLEFNITANQGHRQNYYIFSTEALEPSPYNMTPFWEDVEDNYQDAIITSTEITNEASFTANDDGTLNLVVPWIAFAFYGPSKITAYSIDDNTYDFFRSLPFHIGDGGSLLSPGEIQNVIYHVEGGIGIFGSMSSVEAEVYLDRPAEP
ncbi:DUF4249 family protein [Balneolaceae bacterium ANBcel3]|nr:DUF4249 family protein [Balneolaceae bacterium ANBcel3]